MMHGQRNIKLNFRIRGFFTSSRNIVGLKPLVCDVSSMSQYR